MACAMANDCAGFESYRLGSWWEVQIKEERSDMFFVRFKNSTNGDPELAWLPITELRMRSRKADSWDCYSLRMGVDVSVLSKHPHSKATDHHGEALYDAQVSSVKKVDHAPGQCSCMYAVQFFSIGDKLFPDGRQVQRTLLTGIPAAEMSMSQLRILQQPSEKISFDHVLEAHMNQTRIPMGRVCNDALFLAETYLSISRNICLERSTTQFTCMRSRFGSREGSFRSRAQPFIQNGEEELHIAPVSREKWETLGSRIPARVKLEPSPNTNLREDRSVERRHRARDGFQTRAGRSPPHVQMGSCSEGEIHVKGISASTGRSNHVGVDFDKGSMERVVRRSHHRRVSFREWKAECVGKAFHKNVTIGNRSFNRGRTDHIDKKGNSHLGRTFPRDVKVLGPKLDPVKVQHSGPNVFPHRKRKLKLQIEDEGWSDQSDDTDSEDNWSPD